MSFVTFPHCGPQTTAVDTGTYDHIKRMSLSLPEGGDKSDAQQVSGLVSVLALISQNQSLHDSLFVCLTREREIGQIRKVALMIKMTSKMKKGSVHIYT